jgi:hypothetical protein
MESIFRKVPTPRAPTVYDRIGPEIKHLLKGASVRDAHSRSRAGAWAASIAVAILLWLFFMDPFLYSFHKSAAMRAYVYLHNYNSASATDGLIASGMFTKDEILTLNERHGSFQSYFSSPTDAEQGAANAVAFMNGLHALHFGQYAQLDPIGKIRYLLFVRMGIYPPMVWSGLNPAVE